MTGKTMKNLLVLLTFLASLAGINADPVMSKANETRLDILKYMRSLETIVRNYPGKDKEGKDAQFDAPGGSEGDRIAKYNQIKRLFQEGITYYYEGRYPNSYRRFLEAQANIEQLTEDLSQIYIEGTDEILKSVLEKKDPKGDANGEYKNASIDKDFVDISVEFGRGSEIYPKFKADREAPAYSRLYEPREYHYAFNKERIEGVIGNGYNLIGEAKSAKLKALKIEQALERHQKLQPSQRKQRIEKYFEVIAKCRESRRAAFTAYALKYPHDNEYLQKDEKFKLEGEANTYRINPYVDHANPYPLFDNRIPPVFRRDAVDTYGHVFIDEVNKQIKFKYNDVDVLNRDLARYGDKERLDKPSKQAEAEKPAK